MKCVVETKDVDKEGLEAFLGNPILIFCANYIYTGKLVGVNTNCVKLIGAKLVYETGAFSAKAYANAEDLPGGVWYVGLNMIESFGPSK